MIEANLGNYGSACTSITQGLGISKELGHKQFIAYAFGCLGDIERKKNAFSQAYISYRQSLLLWQELGNLNGVAQVLDGLAHLSTQEKDWRRATYLLGAADSLRKTISISNTPAKQIEFERIYAELSAQLSENDFSAAKEQGQNMTLEQVINYALKQVPGTPR